MTENRSEYRREYYEKNREWYKQYNREYYKNNRERIKLQSIKRQKAIKN